MDMANLNLDNLKYQITTSQLKVIIRKIQKKILHVLVSFELVL